MGKQGPCYHCGTHSTPLWRNGPPEKPVLCNACGSRYRIRGTLANYTPKHAQGQPLAKRLRTISKCSFKTEENYSSSDDDDSTQSAISCSLSSCSFIGNEENAAESLATPPVSVNQNRGIQESFWKSCIPSRKRSLYVQRSLTPIERFQRELRNILVHDPLISSENEDDILIYNSNHLRVSRNEIGLGSFLLKPNTAASSTEIAPPPAHETFFSLVDVKPSLVDIKDSGWKSSLLNPNTAAPTASPAEVAPPVPPHETTSSLLDVKISLVDIKDSGLNDSQIRSSSSM
ncbi:GATA transcription factor 26-like [Manihot esculenta]|uniref:GATA transcription factor 26-like n=1 Tax=Manihot esculenta TaxID=3983 RepID=UPI001CC7F55A|nr:GATA transcription factor 26-like [Manihot esculenta]